MNSIKLLFVSFTITFVALMTISPVNAKPIVKVQHLNVNNFLTSKFNSNDIINLTGTLPSNLSGKYLNSFSTGLISSDPLILGNRSPQLSIDVVNKSNDFFTSAMVFNDKLHQFISYFTTPINETLTKQTVATPDSKVIKKKCENILNFS